MNTTLKLMISGDAKGLEDAAKKADHALDRFSKKAAARIVTAGRGISTVSEKIAGGMAGIGGGLALGLATRQIVGLDTSIARLGVQARDTVTKMGNGDFGKGLLMIKSKIQEVAAKTGQSSEDIVAGMNAIVERTGNMDLAVGQMDSMAIAATASGAAMQDVGAMVSNMATKMNLKPEQMMKALNGIVVQGKVGAFTLKDMADQGERLFVAAQSGGLSGEAGIRSFGALVQVARMGTGSAEQATTAIENMNSEMLKLNENDLKKQGIDIKLNNADGTRKDFLTLTKDIIQATKGDSAKLVNIFGAESIRAVQPIANAFKQDGDFRLLDQLRDAAGDAKRMAEIMDDYNSIVNTTEFQMARLRETTKQTMDQMLTEPLGGLNKALKWANEHSLLVKDSIKAIVGLMAAAAAVNMFRGTLNTYRDIKDAFSRKSKSSPMDAAASSLNGIQRVWVVNAHEMGKATAPSDPMGLDTPDAQKKGKPTAQLPTGQKHLTWLEKERAKAQNMRYGGKFSQFRSKANLAVINVLEKIPSRISTLSTQIGTKLSSWLPTVSKWASKLSPSLGAVKSAAGGTMVGAGLDVGMSYLMNGQLSMKDVARIGGGALGGLLGLLGGGGVGSAALGMGGYYAGSKGGEWIYDMIASRYGSNAQGAAQNALQSTTPAIDYNQMSMAFQGAISNMWSQAPANLLSPTIQMSTTFDMASGKSSQSVSGPGASNWNLVQLKPLGM